jgi:molybdate transport system regulatory protein
VNARITLLLKSGQRLYSTITEEAVEDLHIEVGEIVTVICKSSNVWIVSSESEAVDNRLVGKVVHLEQDRHNAKVVVDIGGHDRMVSVLSLAQFENADIQEDSTVVLGIEAKNIMLGR